MPAFAQWRRVPGSSSYQPWAIHVLEILDGRITGLNFFLDTERLWPHLGLPSQLED